MASLEKRDVIERIVYNVLEGTQRIPDAKRDAERDMETQINLNQSDLDYIRSRVNDYVKKNEQWFDDDGKLQTTDVGRTLLSLIR